MNFFRRNKLINDLIRENNALTSIITTKLSLLASQYSLIIKNQLKMEKTLADIQADLTALQQSVAAENSVIDSAVTLINGFGKMIADLKQQLADALATEDQAAIQQVVANMEQLKLDIDAKSQSLASSVTANTPTDQTGDDSNAGAGDDSSDTSDGNDGGSSGASPGNEDSE